MTKYRTQSANVLNESDSFERRVNWILFREEQETRLWSDPRGWRPGVPLFVHPQSVWPVCDDPDCGCDAFRPPLREGQHPQYEGNAIRQMISIIDDTVGFNSYVRCQDCEVGFSPKETICWNCGKDVGVVRTFDPYAWAPASGIASIAEVVEMVEDSFGIRVTMRFDEAWTEAWRRVQEDMRRFSEQMDRMIVHGHGMGEELRGIGWASQPIRLRPAEAPDHPPQIQGTRCDFNIMDESEVFSTLSGIDFDGSTNLFLSNSWQRNGIELPEDLDLSGRREIEPPVLNFSTPNFEETSRAVRYYMDRPITERRRET